MKNFFLKFKWLSIGAFIAWFVLPAIVYAVNVTIPQATQKGDLPCGQTTGNYNLLHPGTNGKVLTASSTAPCGIDYTSVGGTGTVTSVDMTVPTGLTVSGNPIVGAGTLALSLQAGYNIPLNASTTNWNGFYNTPSTRITAGTNLLWAGNTLSSDPIDVFLIGGQSNAQGFGSSTLSSLVPSGKVLQYYSAAITDANDPVGNASSGSAWPAFGNAYYQATGHKVLFVPSAVNGSSQTSDYDPFSTGNWDASGTLYGTSVTNVTAATAAATAAGYIPTFKGVLWMQGETNAIGINAAATTVATYKAALIAMIARYRTQYGTSTPFYMSEIGTQTDGSDVGYAQVRAAQEQVASTSPYTRIVFRNAIDFPSRNLMAPPPGASNLHFSQQGYEEMGKIMAANITSYQSYTFFQHASTTEQSIYFTGGNIGIGTTTPTAKLDLWGTSASTLPVFNISSSSGASYLTVLANGNVGIGTSTPGGALDVQGYIRCMEGGNNVPTTGRGIFCLTTSGLGLIGAYDYNTNSYMPFLLNGNPTSINALSHNNAGIGTLSPTATLHVVGTGTTTPLIVASSSGTSLLTISTSGDAAFGSQYYSNSTNAATTTVSTITKTIDFNNGNVQSFNLTTSTTFSFSNIKAAGRYLLILQQDSTGSRTVTWPASAHWPGGTTPTLTTTANKVDVITFVCYSTSVCFGGSNLNYAP